MRAEAIARALNGQWCGSGWMARCPAHDDRKPSLSIRAANDGKVLVRCHAGCDQDRVIGALRSRGLWDESGWGWAKRPVPHTQADGQLTSDNMKRGEAALAIWQSALPVAGTLVESYLAVRGLQGPIPTTLRFHGRLRHPAGGSWPVMVALVTRGGDNAPLAIHRTFLAVDGHGKAPVDPQKMMLGPCRGGAVRLAAPGEVLYQVAV
jgi:putative DNA primase/helicase